MYDIHRHTCESATQWLNRLRQIDERELPPHVRRALALSLSYARYQAQQSEGRGMARQCRS